MFVELFWLAPAKPTFTRHGLGDSDLVTLFRWNEADFLEHRRLGHPPGRL